MKRFEGKAALITGAAAGIGRATAQRLADEGASLYLVDVARAGLAETERQCAAVGSAVTSAPCDVSNPDQVEAAVRACVDRFGRLDALLNIAGVLLLEHAHATTLEQFERILRINLTGTFLCCKAALPHLLASKGNIVNTSSTSALAGMPYGAAYGASKAGVLALTRSLAVEYGKQGVRCNAVCPGSIATAMGASSNLPEGADMDLVRRAMALDQSRGPEVVASVIAMLASADGAHINGESIRMDGGTLA